jgi:ABC-type sugar transport system ATPase subunit
MSSAESPQVLLEVRDLSKTFVATRALRRVSLRVHSGEVVAIVGQNGSGKSTLIKVLAGFHEADAGGAVLVRGENVPPGGSSTPALHFIHQDLALVPMLTTVENLRLAAGRGSGALRAVRPRREAREARAQLRALDADIDVTVPISQLTPAERAMVAIARALHGWERADNLLVLDEPTASLHQGEVARLFAAVRRVAAAGAGVIFVSHRLDEVEELADRVVVFRDGEVVADVPRGGYSQQELVKAMVGQDVRLEVAKDPQGSTEEVLRLEDLHGPRLAGLSLRVARGEILGISGLIGSGVETLGSVVAGGLARTSGTVAVAGRAIAPGNPRAALRAGLAHAPADRLRRGAVMTMNVRENLTLPLLTPLRGWLGNLRHRAERSEVRRWVADLDVRPKDPELLMTQLSGGNQQKVVLAKWLRAGPDVLWLDEPTQGVDVAAKAAIHELIVAAVRDGAAAVVASTDAKELVALCHRVVVLDQGRVVADVPQAELSEERLVRESMGRLRPVGSRNATEATA